MLLEGSCHCGAIHIRVRSAHLCPFNLCCGCPEESLAEWRQRPGLGSPD